MPAPTHQCRVVNKPGFADLRICRPRNLTPPPPRAEGVESANPQIRNYGKQQILGSVGGYISKELRCAYGEIRILWSCLAPSSCPQCTRGTHAQSRYLAGRFCWLPLLLLASPAAVWQQLQWCHNSVEGGDMGGEGHRGQEGGLRQQRVVGRGGKECGLRRLVVCLRLHVKSDIFRFPIQK